MFNGRNHADFNENWKTFIEFYDCRQVFEPDYEAPAADADPGDIELHNRHTASARMFLWKCFSPTVKKIIRVSSEDTPLAMFERLQQKFFQNDTNDICTVSTSVRMCIQGPEDSMIEYLG